LGRTKSIDQILKDIYKFYKHSPKRKKALANEAQNSFEKMQDDAINNLRAVMIDSVQKGISICIPVNRVGKAIMEKIPTLQLKKWNGTRWLGRAECLSVFCDAYIYVLNHLRTEMTNRENNADTRKRASDVYAKLTDYDTFLFIFFYRDVTALVARTSKSLQARDLQIPDVGRLIITLSKRLETSYPLDSPLPTDMIGDGYGHGAMAVLFGDDLNGNHLVSISMCLSIVDVMDLEKALQEKGYLSSQVVSTITEGRTTRGVDNSSKYSELLSKKQKADRLQVVEMNAAIDSIHKDECEVYYFVS
jgi:hypothetical protein